MSKLACNIVIYRPDPEQLAAKYRSWHVEALLDQAGTLVDRCLGELREYSRLDHDWNQLESELENLEKKLGMYRLSAEQEVFDREGGGHAEAPEAEEAPQSALEQPETEHGTEAGEPEQAKEEAPEVEGLKSSLDFRVEAVKRRKELSAPGGPFALNEQRDLALRRLCRDYEAAVDRACVAEQGLTLFYDHEPETRPLPLEAETLGTSITSLALWIRDAREFVEAYRLREQSFTRVVSVRSLLNRNAWALLRHARDSYAMKLQVPVDLFRDHDNCRVRGISAYLVGEAGTVPWSLVVGLPVEAVYERGGHSVEVDQSERPSCLVGRLENRRSGRLPEICGEGTLVEASPIGRSTQGGLWALEIFKPMGASSETFGHIEDLVLEIHTAGMPH